MAIIKEIKITGDYITLGQLLKIEDLVSSGGETKFFLSQHDIKVNGEKEDRRGRKLYAGDLIEIEDKRYKLC